MKQIDVNQLDEVELRELIAALMRQVDAQKDEIAKLRRMLFGRRSEKTKFLPGQDPLPFAEFAELKVELADATAALKPIDVLLPAVRTARPDLAGPIGRRTRASITRCYRVG